MTNHLTVPGADLCVGDLVLNVGPPVLVTAIEPYTGTLSLGCRIRTAHLSDGTGLTVIDDDWYAIRPRVGP
ncbi:MAG: hypothetical protein ACRDQW_05735 [Haloechinothrix sp.]